MDRGFILVILLVQVSFLGTCHGFPLGAPSSQCASLKPDHGAPAKDNSNIPYSIKLNSTEVSPGASILIELTNDGSTDTFKGYMVQARKDSDDSVIGTFETVSEDAQYLKCGKVAQSAVTHVSKKAKNSMQMRWKAPSDFTGKVTIFATFVRDYNSYWVKVPSESVEVLESSSSSKEIPPETTTSGPKSEPESKESNSQIYKDCENSKSCFGAPNGCLDGMDCNLFVSWKPNKEYFEFEMFRKQGTGNYVAVGFSKDSNMGNELVLACANPTSAELYWNSGKSSPTYLSNSFGILDYKFSSKEGDNYCRMKSPSMIKSKDFSVNLKDDQQTILLAGGPYSTKSLKIHTMKLAAGEPVSLSQVSVAGAKSDILVKLHGLFMLMAWLGCAGAGIIMARYFKQTWKGKPIFGADRWFQAHRLFMVVAVVLTVAAVVVIVVEVGMQPFSAKQLSSNAHPVIGLICVVLASIQPTMAAFRPHPGDSGRKLFNWAHWGVGNLAHGFGICAIFLAGNLSKANLSSTEWWSWLLLAFAIFHFLTHLVYSFLWHWANKAEKSQRGASGHQMTEINGMTEIQNNNFQVDEKQDQKGGSYRKILFLMYVLTAWVVVAVLAVAVFQAEG